MKFSLIIICMKSYTLRYHIEPIKLTSIIDRFGHYKNDHFIWFNLMPNIIFPIFYNYSLICSVGKESVCNARDSGSIPGLGRSTGEGKGYVLQYSGLENSMDYIIHGVAKSQMWFSLSCFLLSSFYFHFHAFYFFTFIFFRGLLCTRGKF